MSYLTPAALRLKADLAARFPGIQFGIYNRRKIAGSTTWSQHSWPNALDIFFTSYGDRSAAHQQMLDQVAKYIRDNYARYDVRYLLWKNNAAHQDHIHVDFWPFGYGTPSLTRGGADNLYKTQSGIIITQAQLEEGDNELALLTEAEQQQLKDFLKFIKDEGSNVGFVKYAIQLIREERDKALHTHPDELFDPADYEIIIKRKEV